MSQHQQFENLKTAICDKYYMRRGEAWSYLDVVLGDEDIKKMIIDRVGRHVKREAEETAESMYIMRRYKGCKQ